MPGIHRRSALTATSLATLGLALPGQLFARTGNGLDASRTGLPPTSVRLVSDYQMEVRA